MTLAIDKVDGRGLSNTTLSHCAHLHGKEDEVEAVLAKEGRHINYLAVATRQSASVIKVSVRMHSDAFKRRLAFSFIVIKSFISKALEFKFKKIICYAFLSDESLFM